jgi:hypothetical protein
VCVDRASGRGPRRPLWGCGVVFHLDSEELSLWSNHRRRCFYNHPTHSVTVGVVFQGTGFNMHALIPIGVAQNITSTRINGKSQFLEVPSKPDILPLNHTVGSKQVFYLEGRSFGALATQKV